MFKQSLALLSLLFFLLSCNQTSESKTPVIAAKTDSIPKKDSLVPIKDTIKKITSITDAPSANLDPNNLFNHTAAVYSGYKGKAGKLNYLFDTLAWARHAKYIDSSWRRMEARRLNAMKKWGRQEFAKENAACKTVFYPFSGPDYLTANAFFPDADRYIMLGLEPIGKLPELKKFKAGDHLDYSDDFKRSLGDIFDKSYFITRKMLQDFQAQKVNGLLPILTFFIKRSGNEILDIKYVVKYNQDSIREVSYDYKDKDFKPFGVRVDFMQEGKAKTVYYFRYDVSNKKFNDTTVFYTYLKERTPGCITYIKSASYLLHNNFMSNMKDMILKNSQAIVQDDTGIPYKYILEDGNYDTKLYGQYTKPVSDFPYLSLQKPLQEAFEKDSSKISKLPFHLGYHWGSKKDVIIYATRK